MKRRFAAATMAIAVLFILTGCFKADTSFTVNPDDTVDGTLVLAFEKDVYEQMQASGQDMSTGEGFSDFEEMGGKVSTEPYEDGDYVGQKVTFTDAPLDKFIAALKQDASGAGNSKLGLVHHGDQYSFRGRLDLTADSVAGASGTGSGDQELNAAMSSMMAKMMKDAEIRFSITLPGTITDASGEVSGNTVAWIVPYGKKAAMKVSSSTAPDAQPAAAAAAGNESGRNTAALMAIMTVMGLGVAGTVYVFFVRPRRMGADDRTADDDDYDYDDDEGLAGASFSSPGHLAAQGSTYSQAHGYEPGYEHGYEQPSQPTFAQGTPPQPVQSPAPQIEPGWYPTADGNHVRYHDGNDWTEHVRPTP